MNSADREVTVENDDYPGGWFGESWGAEVCEISRHRPTPVGAICLYCGFAIGPDDQGLLIPNSAVGPDDTVIFDVLATHLHCFLREVGVAVNELYCEICHGFHRVEQDCDP